MKEDFSSSATGMGHYSGPEAPFKEFQIPQVVQSFVENLMKSQVAQQAGIETIVLFGGAITDQRLGQKPKDYDLYICSPKLVADIKNIQGWDRRGSSYEDIEEYFGYDFPVHIHEDSITTGKPRLLDGQMVAVNGYFNFHGRRQLFDVAISDTHKTPLQLSQLSPAPVMSGAVSLYPKAGEFAYHKDFELHASRRILCTNEDTPGHFEDKARRKGLSLIRPEQLSAYLGAATPENTPEPGF